MPLSFLIQLRFKLGIYEGAVLPVYPYFSHWLWNPIICTYLLRKQFSVRMLLILLILFLMLSDRKFLDFLTLILMQLLACWSYTSDPQCFFKVRFSTWKFMLSPLHPLRDRRHFHCLGFHTRVTGLFTANFWTLSLHSSTKDEWILYVLIALRALWLSERMVYF